MLDCSPLWSYRLYPFSIAHVVLPQRLDGGTDRALLDLRQHGPLRSMRHPEPLQEDHVILPMHRQQVAALVIMRRQLQQFLDSNVPRDRGGSAMETQECELRLFPLERYHAQQV